MSIPSAIEVLAPDAYSGPERRREPRVPVDVEARLKCLNPLTSVGPSIRARVVEISRSGMKLRANRELQPGAVVQIIVGKTFYLATARHSRRAGDTFETGVQLTERIPSSLL